MKPQMRRILAYVIARLVADTESSAIYDYQESAYFNFNGEFTADSIRVLDYIDSSYLKGNRTMEKDGFSLHLNFADGSLASVDLKKGEGSEVEFHGAGRGQAMHFHGVAEKNGRVSFYDSSTGMYYKLKI